MQRYVIPLLAALAAGPAPADQEPIPPQAYVPMVYPVPAAPYNPYAMMPFGVPMGSVPAMLPYAVPVQTMPYLPFVPYPVAPLPAPETAAAPDSAAGAPVPGAVAASQAPAAQPAAAVPANPAANPYLSNVPQSPFSAMLAPATAHKPYEMRRVIAEAEKTQLMQMALPMVTSMMKMGMPDAMNYFARKYKAKPGLSFDDVRDSLFLRANQVNMKKVGENLMWMDFKAVLNDQTAPRIEVYSFCDIAVARELLQISPEFIIFLPCRIAVVEDADKNIWVLMLDWNLDWVAGYEQKLGLTNDLMKGAKSINDRMDEMMRAAANGDL